MPARVFSSASLTDEVIESTELRAFYELRSEHGFSDVPRETAARSAESPLAALRG